MDFYKMEGMPKMKAKRLVLRLHKGEQISLGMKGRPDAIGTIRLDDSFHLQNARLVFEYPPSVSILRSNAKIKK